MAIVQKTTGTLNSNSTISPSLAGVTAGNTLALLLSTANTSDVLPTDSSTQTWSKAFYLSNGAASVAVYYLLSANSGTHTVTWASGGTSYVNYALVEIPTCSAVDLVSTVGTASNTTTTISTPSITTTNATDAIFALMSADAATGLANAAITDPPSGYTSVYAQQVTTANEGGQLSYKEVTSTGAQSVTWTFGADTTGALYAAAAVAFKQGASSVSFAGAGVAKATGSASLTPKARFAGSGTAATTGSANFAASGVACVGAGVSQATGSASLTARAIFSGSGVATAAGAATFAATVPVITLKQYWLKPWQTGTTAATLQSGSNPMTVAAGSTLIAVWAGWDSAQIAAPVISAGSFTTPTNGAQFNGSNITTAIAYQANAAGGSVTTTAPNVAVGNSGEVGLWIYEVKNMPATAVVRNCAGAHVVSASQSWSQSSDASPQIGDLVFGVTSYENSVGSVNAGLTDPPSGWTSQGVNQDATNFVPTEICSKLVTSAGVQTASWSNTDAATTEHLSVMLALVPAAGAAASFSASANTVATGSAALTARANPVGAGAVGSIGSASLTTQAALTGAGIATATGSAAATVRAALAGSGSVIASGSGAVVVMAALAGSGAAPSAGSAALTGGSAGVVLVGAGIVASSGAAALTVSAALAGSGAANATGVASLTGGSAGAILAGSAVARAAGSASLTTAAALVGSGVAQATGGAALSTSSSAVSFAASGSSSAQGSAALSIAAALAGGGFSIATAAGVLTIGGGGVSFVAAGSASASGSASLTGRPRFAGVASTSAVGSGVLALASPFVPGNEAVWLVPAMNRSTQVSKMRRVSIAHSRSTVKT